MRAGSLLGAKALLLFAIALTLLAAGAAGATAATNPVSSPSLPGHPSVTLPAAASGAAAVDALGPHLSDVAKFYRWTPGQLTSRLKRDKDLKVDKRGYLFYTEAALTASDVAAAKAAAGAAAAPAGAEALAPLADTFRLHSLPGAAHIIYLDFDGHTLHADAWTDDNNGGNDIVAPPFDTDGNPASFSDAELTTIQQVWQRAAEDYAPFNVDVTTEYLGESYITRSSGSDNLYGMRVLISPMSGYIGHYGGMAYIGVFDSVGDYYKPALVFPENLIGGNEKIVGEAAAHENGHTLGLSHQGTTTGTDYYLGQGSGDTGWAPIMGAGYYKNLTQWSKGEYLNANETEDEIAIMGTYGAPLRTDDVGDTTASATNLGSTGTPTASGIISSSGDADVFRVSLEAGSVTATATPAALGPDLDILLDLLDPDGNVMASDNPSGLLTACITTNVPAGTYYLRVRGTGKGDPLVDGYTSYGSLGAYTISVTSVNGPPAAPTGLSATGTSSSTILVGWTDNAINETGYHVYRWNPETSTWESIVTTAADATSHPDTGLAAGTGYSYRVAAFNSYGETLAAGPVAGSTLPAITRYDNTNPLIARLGAWAIFATPSAYNGSYGRSSTSGASATIWFTGTRLDWIAMKGTTTGSADVYLDGVKVTTVNLAAASATYQVNVWSTGTLSDGAHNVRIVRSAASPAGKFVTLDAVDIWGTITAPPATLTRSQQSSTAIAKTGTWYTYTAAGASGGSYGRSSTGGASPASATIYFIGNRLDWIGMKGLTTGIADVYLDGVKVATINLAAAAATYNVAVWSTGPISLGAHIVRIVRSSTSASGKFVTLDAVDIWGAITSGP